MSTDSTAQITHDDSFVYVTVGDKTVKLTPREARELAEALNRDAETVDGQP